MVNHCKDLLKLCNLTDAKKGTVERSSVAGLKCSELMAGLFMNMAALSIIQALICYVSLGFGLGFDIQGSIFPYFCVSLATSFCSGALGRIPILCGNMQYVSVQCQDY